MPNGNDLIFARFLSSLCRLRTLVVDMVRPLRRNNRLSKYFRKTKALTLTSMNSGDPMPNVKRLSIFFSHAYQLGHAYLVRVREKNR